jgi:glycosyltransferase involved in cell wall biosynthesis
VKVALFSSKFLPLSQTFVHDEIRFHRRYDVEVFTGVRMNADLYPFEPVHVGGLPYRLFNFAPSFTRRLRRGDFSLVHAHFGLGGTRAAGFARRAGLPLVITFHGYDVPLLTSSRRFTPEYWGYALTAQRTLARMALGLCASEELRALLVEYGVPEDRLRVWRLGIDLDAFGVGARDPHRPRVTMIGRFVEKKGFEYGVRAFARQVTAGAPGRLTIVGDGERGPRLRALVDELGIADRVELTGPLPPAAVRDILATSDVLLCPSVTGMDGDRESGLVVAKEASASRVVPIGTWHGGIHEIIDDGVTGFLVPERNVAALSDRLGRLLADADLRRRMGAAARAAMWRHYDIRDRIDELESHYDTVRARIESAREPQPVELSRRRAL